VTAPTEPVKAALALARDLAAGQVDPAQLEAELATKCRELFSVVAGPTDPLWELQVSVARQVIEAGGLTLDEIREWCAVLEQRATS
jgi:hypothetical protein